MQAGPFRLCWSKIAFAAMRILYHYYTFNCPCSPPVIVYITSDAVEVSNFQVCVRIESLQIQIGVLL